MPRSIADIIAEDRDGRPVLLVEVKARPADGEVIGQLLRMLDEAPDPIPFVMLVDPMTIRIYRRGSAEPAALLDTVEILSHYAPEYTGRLSPYDYEPHFEGYLSALVQAWLRDLAYRWKSGQPPKLEEIRRIGLSDLLADGTAIPEVPIGGGSLR